MDMFIYSVSTADMSKCKMRYFLHNFFLQDFWNLEITENMCQHTVVTPPLFLKENKDGKATICNFDVSVDHSKQNLLKLMFKPSKLRCQQ